jgi:hypothetical protein
MIKAWKVTKLENGKMPKKPEFFYTTDSFEAFTYNMMVDWIDGTLQFPPAYHVIEVEITKEMLVLYGK